MTPSLDHNTWVTTLLWAKQMKSLESNETITSSQLKIIVIYMWEITCSLHNNFQLSEIVSGVWEMRNFKKFDCLVFCSIIATRPSDKSTVTATRPVWLCHSSGTIGRWFWRPLVTLVRQTPNTEPQKTHARWDMFWWRRQDLRLCDVNTNVCDSPNKKCFPFKSSH